MVSVSVVLPTFNEKESIVSQIRKIIEVTPDLVEIVVVDDDSPDGTWRIVEELGGEDGRIRVLRRTGKRGLASAIHDGVSGARGDVVMWLDCDHDPDRELVGRMVSLFEEGADVTTASRYVPEGSETREPVQKFASMLINGFASLLLDSSIRDYTTGFVATRKSVFDDVGWDRRGYGEYCIEFLYKAAKKGYVVREVPFVCKGREQGSSKTGGSFLSFMRLGLDYGLMVLRLRFSV
ncbi:MAG: glycosyltransferase [Candidatus Altiarchaeota archaeon]